MKKLPFLLIIVGLATVLVMDGCSTANKASTSKMLKFNFQKGKGYDYDMRWDMETSGGGQQSTVGIDASYSMKIIEDDGEVKSVETSYSKMKMDMSVMGMNMTFDSEKPPVDNGSEDVTKNPFGMMNKVIAGILNKPFIIKVNAAGEVLEVTGFDKIVNSILDSTGVDEKMKEQVLGSIKEQFNDQTVRDNFAQVFTIFPNKEVKVGETWEKTYSTGGSLGAKFKTEYTVTDIEGDHVTLTTKSSISPGGGPNITGEQSGNILVDSKTGLMISGSFDQDMKVKSGSESVKLKGKGRIKGTAH